MLIRTIKLLWPLIYTAGLVVSWTYYRKQGKAVISLLLIYFALGLYASTLAPYANRLWTHRHVSSITAKQIERYEAYQKELNALHIKYAEIDPGTLVGHVSIPLGQILLVKALFIFGRRQMKGHPSQQSECTTLPNVR